MAAESLRDGFWGGMRIAVVPLVTETLVLLLTSLAVSSIPDDGLRWVGIVGAIFIFYLAWRTWRDARQAGRDDDDERPAHRSMLEAGILAVVSPNPWLFWLLVGSPVFLSEWRRGWLPAAAFLGSFLFMMVAVQAGVAALAGRGHDKLSPTWRKRLLRGAAGMLVLAGGFLAWKSWTGDFRRMVAGDEIQETLDSVVPRDP